MKKSKAKFFGILAILVGFITLLLPIFWHPISGDDIYGMLIEPSINDNSVVMAWMNKLQHAYELTGTQARTNAVSLAMSDTFIIAVMQIAATFELHPLFVWGIFKLFWLATMFASLWLFLARFEYRNGAGEQVKLSSKTRKSIMALVPIFMAISLEIENAFFNNGWTFYPELTYLQVTFCLLTGFMLIQANKLVTNNPRYWVVRVFIVLFLAAWGLNLSYEMSAIVVPFGLFALAVQPSREGATFWERNKVKFYVGGVFTVTFAVILGWTRWQLAHMACVATNTCYQGTNFAISPEAWYNNFIAAMPGAGISYLGANEPTEAIQTQLIVGIAATVLLIVGTLVLLSRYNVKTNTDEGKAEAADLRFEAKPLMWLSVLMVLLAIGMPILTALNERAVERLLEPISPYRSGPTTTMALAIAGAAALLALYRSGFKIQRHIPKVLIGLLLVCIPLSATNFAANSVITQQTNALPKYTILNDIYQEVTYGNPAADTNEARCKQIADLKEVSAEDVWKRVKSGANQIYQLYKGEPYCKE